MAIVTVYATTGDIEAKLGRALSVSQSASATVLLAEASALLRLNVPGLDDGITAATVDAVLVKKVVTDAVLRVLRNPAGVTTQVVGPESATFSGQAARAELAFLASELAMVTPAPDEGVSAGGQVIGSVRLSRRHYGAYPAGYGWGESGPMWSPDWPRC